MKTTTIFSTVTIALLSCLSDSLGSSFNDDYALEYAELYNEKVSNFFSFGAEYTHTSTLEESSTYLLFPNPTASVDPTMSLRRETVHPKFYPGFKASLGVRVDESVSLDIQYTWLRPQISLPIASLDSQLAEYKYFHSQGAILGPSYLRNLTLLPYLSNQPISYTNFDTQWDMKYNVVDGLFRIKHVDTDALVLCSLLGLKGSWQDTNTMLNASIEYGGPNANTTIPYTASENVFSRVEGVGPQAGFSSVWNFLGGLGFYSQATGSLLWSSTKIERSGDLVSESQETLPLTQIVSLKDTYSSIEGKTLHISPVFDISLGIQIASYFEDSGVGFNIHGGVYASYWPLSTKEIVAAASLPSRSTTLAISGINAGASILF